VSERSTSIRFPYVKARVRFAGSRAQVELVTEALLDTGFDGDIIIPAHFADELGPPDAVLDWQMADGSIVRGGLYSADVQLDGLSIPQPAVATAMGDEFLFGRGLIENYRIVLDHGREVVVEP
jgi:predicted aspartyl protease